VRSSVRFWCNSKALARTRDWDFAIRSLIRRFKSRLLLPSLLLAEEERSCSWCRRALRRHLSYICCRSGTVVSILFSMGVVKASEDWSWRVDAMATRGDT